MAINFAVIASTGGSVLNALMGSAYFRSRIRCVISDRNCGAIDVALKFGVPTKVLRASTGLEFSDLLLQEFRFNPPTLTVSFYTKLFSGEFLTFSKGRLINLHPSILPACPGMDGFGDTLKSGSTFIGSTIHYVDEGVDTGRPLIQAATPFNPLLPLQNNRHQVFIQQCKMLLQVIRWFEEDRVVINSSGHPCVLNASYLPGMFSPNLDFLEAISFNVDIG